METEEEVNKVSPADQLEAKEVLLADLEHVRRLLMAGEEGGEARMNFLLSFASAVGAGLVALHTSDISQGPCPPAWIKEVTIGALGSLVLLCLVVYLRILRRNRVTDHYVVMADKIFEKLRRLGPEIDRIQYNPEWKPKEGAWKYFRGGYAQMSALVMGLLVVALAKVWLGRPWVVPAAAGIAVFVILSVIAPWLREMNKKRSHDAG